MLTQVEAHRLGAAVHALRPDWPLASLTTWIRNHLADYAYRDAAVALTWVACDPATETPGRVLEAGVWWRAAQTAVGTTAVVPTRCPHHPDEKAWSCTACASEAVHPERVAELAAQVRAANPHRRPTRTHPEPPVTDLTAARARADQQAAP